MHAARLFAGGIIGGWLWPVAVAAANLQPSPSYDVRYAAPPSCEDADVFRSAVSRRSPDFPWVQGGVALAIDIARGSDGSYVGSAQLPDRAVRHVQALHCRAVVDALALIVAVALETEQNPVQDLGDRDDAEIRATPADAGVWRSAFGVSATFESSRSPGFMPTLGLFAEIDRPARYVSPRVRASLSLGRRAYDVDEAGSENDEASFGFAGAQLELCPLGVAPLSMCVAGEGGVLRVGTNEALSVGSSTRPWLAGLAGLNLDVPLGSWLVQMRGGIVLPVIRDRFLIRAADGTLDSVHRPGPGAFFGVAVGHSVFP